MTLTATQVEPTIVRYTQPGEVLWVAGKPDTAFNCGDIGVYEYGVITQAGAAAAGAICMIDKKTTITGATTAGFPRLGAADMSCGWGQNDNDLSKTLVPVRPLIGAGWPVIKMTLASYFDDTLAAYSASTPSFTLTTSPGADNDCRGGLFYVYEGSGIGQWGVIASYVHSTKVATLHRKCETALSTDSKVILFENTGSAGGAGFFGRLDLTDYNTMNASAGTSAGNYFIYMDAREIAKYLSVGQILVVPAAAIHMA